MRDVYDSIREPSGSGSSNGTAVCGGVMIKDRQVVPRRWTITSGADGGGATAGAVVPLARWLELKASGGDVGDLGVSIENDENPAVLKPYLAELSVIALRFPTWRDGRAYSQARKLRYLWGFKGVILAHGDVLRDQILWMSRVGFDALHMRADQDPVASLRAFSLYTEFYQY